MLVMLSPAHAGRWADWCERHLISEDPYQYESVPVDKLVDMYRKEAVKCFWSRQQSRHLSILGWTIRSYYPITPAIQDLFDSYSQFEKPWVKR